MGGWGDGAQAETGRKGQTRGRGKASNAVHKFYQMGDSLVDTSHGLMKGAAYRSEEKRIPVLIACEAGELAVVRFLIKVSPLPSSPPSGSHFPAPRFAP